jgi:hypothetical protein
MLNVAKVRLVNGSGVYEYWNDNPNLVKGDLVVVETDTGYHIAEVIGLAEHSEQAHRFIVQRLDRISHKAKEIQMKRQQWAYINREVGHLNVGDIFWSEHRKEYVQLIKRGEHPEDFRFTSLDSEVIKELNVYDVGDIWLVYPAEFRQNIYINWDDVASYMQELKEEK